MVAYKAHNLVVGGSNPPAVTLKEVAPQRYYNKFRQNFKT